MEAMTPERWHLIKGLLEEARQRPRSGRAAWLEQACGGDLELLAEVDSFLAHEDELEGFIEEPALAFLAERTHELEELQPGHEIGPYRLVRLLGKGGMGVVYLAERRQEFEQRVALKLIHPSLASRSMLRRFQDERQILARLEHANIARFLDGGTSEDGVPYFAMELVEGEPIDVYCDRVQLPTQRRLELFEDVCSALQAAHQSLIIHRDLKPSNILIDGNGQAKLLDFGIAKQLRPDGGHEQTVTRPGEQAMTLRYASPEQLKGEPVGTASDVYSLGVVLYQVLTGRLPGGLEGMDRVGLMVAVCQEDPPAPSTVVGRDEKLTAPSGEVRRFEPQAVSRVRDGNPKALRRRLAGDVDAIVMKALRKEPRQRYASVEHLAADIGRHLDGRPVRARQGNLGYKTGKFVRRHRLALSMMAMMVALAVGFTATLVHQLDETQRARDSLDRFSALLTGLMIATSPNRPADWPSPHELLARELNQLDARFLMGDTEGLATFRRRMGEVYFSMGEYDQAADIFLGEMRRHVKGEEDPELAALFGGLAGTYYNRGQIDRAEHFARRSLAIRRQLGVQRDLPKPMGTLAAVLMERGEFQEAQALYHESLQLRLAEHGARHQNVSTSQYGLAIAHLATGDLESAEPLLRQALDIRQDYYGPESPSAATVLIGLGRLEHVRGRLEEAAELQSRALEIRRAKLGEDRGKTALAKKELAGVLLDLGETETAGVLLRQALTTLYDELSPGDRRIAETEALLGVYFAATGRTEAARNCLLESLRMVEGRLGPEALTTQRLRRRLEDL